MLRIATGAISEVRKTARQTAENRDRHIDLIRAVAICAVVSGHWLVIAVIGANGEMEGINALGELPWAHPLTWLFQVMPLFFIVGGYANATSLETHRRKNGDALGWILGRFDRLLRPTTALLVALVIFSIAAPSMNVSQDNAAAAVWVATLPLWFLLVYLAVIALAPVALFAHRRWGFARARHPRGIRGSRRRGPTCVRRSLDREHQLHGRLGGHPPDRLRVAR